MTLYKFIGDDTDEYISMLGYTSPNLGGTVVFQSPIEEEAQAECEQLQFLSEGVYDYKTIKARDMNKKEVFVVVLCTPEKGCKNLEVQETHAAKIIIALYGKQFGFVAQPPIPEGSETT